MGIEGTPNSFSKLKQKGSKALLYSALIASSVFSSCKDCHCESIVEEGNDKITFKSNTINGSCEYLKNEN